MKRTQSNPRYLQKKHYVAAIIAVALVSLISGFWLFLAKKTNAAIATDDKFRVVMPSAFTATQSTDVYLEVAQLGKGNTLDAPESWSKVYIDSGRVNDATIGIYRGGYGGAVDTLGINRGGDNQRLADPGAVKYDFYLGVDLPLGDFTDEIPCTASGGYVSSLSVSGSAMPVDGWYKIDASRFLNNARCRGNRWSLTTKTGKYVLFIKASWTSPAPKIDGEVQGRLNAFKVGAAYANSKSNLDNPLTGYWSNLETSYLADKVKATSYSVQDRKSPNGTQGDYTFRFAPDCRIAQGQTDLRYLHWRDVDSPDYYPAPQAHPYFELYEINPARTSRQRVLTVKEDTKVEGGKLPFNGPGGQNVHGSIGYTFKGGYTYEWVWRNITRIDGVSFWLPYDDYPSLNGGCGTYKQSILLKAGNRGTLSDSATPFRARGGDTIGVNITEDYEGGNAQVPTGPTTLTVSPVSSASPAVNRTFDSARMSIPLDPVSNKYNDPSAGLLTTRWTFQGLGPGTPYSLSRSFTTYYTLKDDAPDGAQYCFNSTVSPESNANPGKKGSNQVCMIVDNSLKPYISTSGADVHAGDCNVSSLVNRYGDITGPPATQGSNGSVGLYIVSAADTITNFGSGGSAISNTLTFGNGGKYGCMRRPTMKAVQDDVKAAKAQTNNVKTIQYSGTGTFDVSSLSVIGKKYVVEVPGSIAVTGTSAVPVTINAPNGTVTIAGGSFGGDAGKVTDQKNLPVVMVIAKDIDISKDVKNITALLYAENTIDTCSEVGDLRSAANVNNCKNLLTLNGFAMANNFSLKRTTGSNGLAKAEDLVFNAAFYLNPPVGGGAATSAIKYLGERAPLY